MTQRQFAIIAYDIPDDRRRRQIASFLNGKGERVQYSVFELHVPPDRLASVAAGLRERMNPSEDHVRIYRLCASCEDRVEVVGGPPRYETPSVWIA